MRRARGSRCVSIRTRARRCRRPGRAEGCRRSTAARGACASHAAARRGRACGSGAGGVCCGCCGASGAPMVRYAPRVSTLFLTSRGPILHGPVLRGPTISALMLTAPTAPTVPTVPMPTAPTLPTRRCGCGAARSYRPPRRVRGAMPGVRRGYGAYAVLRPCIPRYSVHRVSGNARALLVPHRGTVSSGLHTHVPQVFFIPVW